MPWNSLPKSKWDEMDRCVLNLKKQGKKESNAIAICMNSMQKSLKSKKKANDINDATIHSVVDIDTLVAAQGTSKKLPAEIPVLPFGDFNTQVYGPMQINEAHGKQMVANFNNNIRAGVPIDIDHNPLGSTEAGGWIKKLVIKDDGVWAIPEFNSLGEEKINDKRYRFLSPEWSFDYVDPLHGGSYGTTLVALTLTNRPLFREMKSLTASEFKVEKSADGKTLTKPVQVMLLLGQDIMRIEDLVTKNPEELTEEEKTFLRDNQDQLSEEDKTKFTAVLEEDKESGSNQTQMDQEEEDEEEVDEVDQEDNKEANDKNRKNKKNNAGNGEGSGGKNGRGVDKNTNKTQNIMLSASEYESLKAKADKGELAASKLEKKEVEDQVESELIKADDGSRIFPKSKDKVVNFLLKASESDRKELMDIFKELPAKKIVGRIGASENDDVLTPIAKFDKLVDKIASEKKLDTPAAIQIARKENPELWEKVKTAQEENN